ncbi:Integrin-like protein [Candidatus Koribacter versatilis Ellin345]|uniref:Integrin-like protein n=1 Tax=Koribacter versatilis (strain Ellin345) TaxID=204669 RepID=Q1IHE0_KORVE|nr:FG-GAP-like repeat-containing protein [Candidatus Koribacter versatilis]ABF43710.1 Integrin-like protein [Candidatus Koribacter versatilis Ellin345]
MDRFRRLLFILLTFTGVALAAVGSSTTTTLSITSAGAPVAYVSAPSTIKLTATVKSSALAVFPGLVKFCDKSINATCSGNAFLGTAQLTSSGKASLATRFGYGAHSLQAIFVGTRFYFSSQSSAASFSQKWKTGASLSHVNSVAGAKPGTFDLSVTLTGLQAAALPAAPTGSISFLDASNGNAVVATAPLGGGAGGTLTVRQTDQPLVGAMPWSAMTADFNNDGIPDVAVHNGEGTLSILLGNGDGTFQPQAKISGTFIPEPQALAIADFNSDGNADLAYATTVGVSGGYSILFGNGNGTFQAPVTTPLPGGGTWGLAAADFNRDGIPDLFALPLGPSGTPIPSGFMILIGNGDGSFVSSTQHPEMGLVMSFATADFNGDGITDLVVGYGTFGNTQLGVLLGNGDGTFQAPASPVALGNSYRFATADLNHDGKLDLVVAGAQSASGYYGAYSLLGNGDGSFQTPVAIDTTSVFPASLADFNFDGIPDVVIGHTDYHGSIEVRLGNGDGSFRAGVTLPTGAYPVQLPIVDLNGDGKPDILVINQGSNNSHPERLNVLLDWWGNPSSVTASSVTITGAGTHNIKASFAGDTNYRQSTSATTAVTVP